MVIGIVLVVALLLYLKYPLCVAQVHGESMFPTLEDGDILFFMRVFFKKRHKYEVGKVYVFHDYKNSLVIKRLSKVSETRGLYFLGDNPEKSYDSRDYGYIPKDRVVGKVFYRGGTTTI